MGFKSELRHTSSSVSAEEFFANLNSDALGAGKLPSGKAFLAYNDPVNKLARAILDGKPVAATLERWEQEASTVLAAFRNNNARLVLVEFDSFLRNPHAYAAIVSGHEIDNLDILPAPPEDVPLIARVVAHVLIDQNRDVCSLWDALALSETRPDNVETEQGFETEELAQKARDALSVNGKENNSTRLKEGQIAQMRALIHSFAQDGDCLRMKLCEARKTADALQKKLDGVYSSKSWRLTRPIRAMRSRISKG